MVEDKMTQTEENHRIENPLKIRFYPLEHKERMWLFEFGREISRVTEFDTGTGKEFRSYSINNRDVKSYGAPVYKCGKLGHFARDSMERTLVEGLSELNQVVEAAA